MRETLHKLGELALTNRADFARDVALLASYERALATPGAMVYALDSPETGCRARDCWATWRELVEPLGGAAALLGGSAPPIVLDCEDDASALAAWLDLDSPGAGWVGIVPGRRISHAIAGLTRHSGEKPRPLDPAVWHGMPGASTLDYGRAIWRRLADMRG